ncbi:hypothetical protein SAY87_016373 [Trapa incisa]|uniref:Uncharacterized protein n=1 Tax=Trapa incisa TaxID=236973 RepID=A0AAN7L5Y7_9MYRT|nr:hypothetical protein SAY87_016373 [Trapa incisa]
MMFLYSVLQDIHQEFDMMHIERKQLEMELATKDLKIPLRRKYNSRLREVRRGIRVFEKLTSTVSSVQLALQMVLSESSGISEVLLILGSSPLRPRYVYELSFLHGKISQSSSSDYNKCKEAEVLSKKTIRMLISKGVGSSYYPGPTKLFIMVRAPFSFNQPLHFLPKREFKYNKKIVPFRLQFKCRKQDRKLYKWHPQSETGSPRSLEDNITTDLIWYQCRHVVKGLISKVASSE